MKTTLATLTVLALTVVGCGGKKERGSAPAPGSVAAQVTQPFSQPTANPTGPIPVSAVVSGPSQPKVGDTITVSVRTGGMADLYGAAFDLNYNQAVMDLVGSDAQAGLLGNGELVTADRNGKPGRLVVGVTLVGNVPSAAGSGEVVKFFFRAKAQGTSAFTLTEGAVFDSNGDPLVIAAGTTPTVTVQ